MKRRKAGRPSTSVRQWLEKLPEPYRSLAITNTPDKVLSSEPNTTSKTLAGALFSAFVFDKTPEGGDYWYQFYKSIL